MSRATGPSPGAAGRRIPLPMLHTDESSARVRPFELFFDLVYVFAFTQVSRLMAETHSATGVLQALTVLALLWWTWVGFSWISNQASVDQPGLRVGLTVTMIAVFVAALTIPEAYDDLEGGWSGPLVFAIAYAVVRIAHLVIYATLSADDPALRRQLLIFLTALIPGVALIVIGAVVGGPAQLWLWIAAVVYDVTATRVGSTIGRGWRIPSAEHWAERYGLVVILALGESIVAIGVGVAQEPIDLPIVMGTAASIVLSMLLWWSYFARLAGIGEERLAERDQRARATLAADAYSYTHFVIIAGIIIAALGIEDAMKHIDDPEPFGWFGAIALGSGIAAFAAGTIVFALFVGLRRPIMRAVEAVVLIAAIPLLAAVSALAALVIAVVLMAVIALMESALHRRAEGGKGASAREDAAP
ncbi:low temperature requirement protein A [Microbacterium sp. BK668]|uniref:low temperature requirement protein A n=1 Tax=Microbacterium sp. BK668 TaxID=2512118 RepID=UPI001414FE86|nr:low temperature requirement protein A [Microbacterium sp. BK668]